MFRVILVFLTLGMMLGAGDAAPHTNNVAKTLLPRGAMRIMTTRQKYTPNIHNKIGGGQKRVANTTRTNQSQQRGVAQNDMPQVITTAFVQDYLRYHAGRPDLNLDNVTPYTIASEEYVLDAIDFVNGDTDLVQYARPNTLVGISYLPNVFKKADVCPIPWTETPEMMSYIDEHMVWTDGTIPYGAASWGAIVYGDNKYVCFGDGDTTIVSTNGGKTWEKQAFIPNASGILVYGDGRFFVLQGDVLFVSNDGGNSWDEYDNVPDGSWWHLAYGGGRLVAVGNLGASGQKKTIISDDYGQNWTEVDMPGATVSWHSLIYADNKFVSVGWVSMAPDSPPGDTQIAILPDGEDTWHVVGVPEYNWSDIAYGNGRFVVVSGCGLARSYCGATLYSDDGGDTWNLSTDAPLDATHVAFGNNRFVATERKTGAIAYSSDGVNWEYVTDLQMGYDWGNDVVFGNDGRFVAVGTGGVALYSDNGIDWHRVDIASLGNDLWLGDMAYGDGVFVALDAGYHTNYDHEGNIAVYSNDGIHWKSAIMPKRMAWGKPHYTDGKFVTLGRSYNVGASVPEQDMIAYSTDGGKTWIGKDLTLVSDNYWASQSIDYVGGRLFRTLTEYDDNWNEINTISVSADFGDTWTPIELPNEYDWFSFVYGDDMLWAYGDAHIATSTNGINWTVYPGTPPIDSYFDVVYGNGRFLAIGNDGKVSVSTNGTNWADAVSTELTEISNISVSYLDGQFIASGVIYSNCNEYGNCDETGVLLLSQDGLTWERLSFDTDGFRLFTHGDNKIVLAGDDNKFKTSAIEINGDTHSWAVGNGCSVTDAAITCDDPLVGGVATCKNAKCSCLRQKLINKSGEYVDNVAQTPVEINRKFADQNACNLQCADVCVDNAVNNTDGVQKDILCGK